MFVVSNSLEWEPGVWLLGMWFEAQGRGSHKRSTEGQRGRRSVTRVRTHCPDRLPGSNGGQRQRELEIWKKLFNSCCFLNCLFNSHLWSFTLHNSLQLTSLRRAFQHNFCNLSLTCNAQCTLSSVWLSSTLWHMAAPQIYETHIYTKATFTQTQICTAQIYTDPSLRSPILAYPNLHNSIYTELNPNLHRPKFSLRKGWSITRPKIRPKMG